MKTAVLVDTPAQFRTAAFLRLRNEWYRKAEATGIEIDELGYKNGRERAKKGLPIGDARFYSTSRSESQSAWDSEDAEYWRLVAAEVAKLPDSYFGKAFLARWAEIGDVKNAALDTRVSRWTARRTVEQFVNMLKRKRVLR